MKHAAIALCLLLLIGVPSIATEEDRALLDWFGEIAMPPLAKAPLVRVATGQAWRDGDEWRVIQATGFLLEDDGKRFTILVPDLERRTFERTTDDVPPQQRVAYERLDFATTVSEMLANEERVRRIDALVLARACRERGSLSQADAFLARAKAFKGWRKGEADWTLEKRVREDLSELWMWRAIRMFGEPEVGRPEILALCEKLSAELPASTQAKRAAKTASLLAKMIAEDEVHANTASPLAELSGDALIAELVFRLRDQNGQQWSQPGSCDVFADPREEESPAHRLLALGYDAVPALIAALEDERFSRSVGYWRDFTFSHYVLRVGDCALAVLQRIAGKSFYIRRSTSGAMLKDGEAKATRRAVETWWSRVEEKGEKAVLEEEVAAGVRDSVWQGQLLLEKYGGDALEALVAGAGAAAETWTRTSLVDLVGKVEGDGPLPFLDREMRGGPILAARVAAAQAMLEHGQGEAVPVMIAEWKNLKATDRTVPYGAESVIRFLVRSGRPEAVIALGGDWLSRNVGMRYEVVDELIGESTSDPAVEKAVEDLLAAALDDTDPRVGLSGSRNGKSYSNPRIADMAGHALSERYPDRCRFDLSASRAARDERIHDLRNEWRARRGLGALPKERIDIASVPALVMEELIAAVVSAESDEDRAEALRAIEARGLGALAGVRLAADELETNDPVRADLDALALRLACVVRTAKVGPRSLPVTGPLEALLRTLPGRPLTTRRFLAIAESYVTEPPESLPALRLTAVKPEDGTGIAIELTLTTEVQDSDGPIRGVRVSEHVSLDGRATCGSAGSGTWVGFLERRGLDDLEAALEKALAAPVFTPFEATVTLAGRRR